MKCFYINLDTAKDRRDAIEANFARVKRDGWSLERIPAVDVAYVEKMSIPGSLQSNEKGCFLSHKEALRRSLESEGPVFILEDDVVLSDKTFIVLDSLMKSELSGKWDVFFTDVCVSTLGSMIDLVVLKNQLSSAQVKTLNLRNLPFCAAAAYVVDHRAKRKLFEILDAVSRFDVPYDWVLRDLVAQGRLEAHVTFPFLTTVGDLADTSSIQAGSFQATDLILNLFRRMTWIDRDVSLHRDVLKHVDSSLSEDARAFGTLWAAIVQKDFKLK